MEDFLTAAQAEISLGIAGHLGFFDIASLISAVPGVDKLVKKQNASGIRGGSSVNVPKSLAYVGLIPGPEEAGTQGGLGNFSLFLWMFPSSGI